MDINKLTAMADRLSIPQLQQAMRDGSLPAYVGMPLLQQKVQESKRLQAAQAARRGPAPTIASQVEGEAAQHEMMKRQALAMQEQMAGTGGISDMLRSPEPEAMAEGGAVAFSGRSGSSVQLSKYTTDQIKDYLTAAANKYGIPPEMMIAQAKLESSFNPNARAKGSTATGIGQFTEGTWKDWGTGNLDDRYNPQISAEVMARYNRANIDKWGGNLQKGFASYHLGPNASAERLAADTAYTDKILGQSAALRSVGAVTQPIRIPSLQTTTPPQITDVYSNMEIGRASLPEEWAALESLQGEITKLKEDSVADKKKARYMALLKAGLAKMAGTVNPHSYEPEGMAEGGAVAFSGRSGSYVQDIYAKLAKGQPLTDEEKLALSTRPADPQQYTGPEPAINKWRGVLNVGNGTAQMPSYSADQIKDYLTAAANKYGIPPEGTANLDDRYNPQISAEAMARHNRANIDKWGGDLQKDFASYDLDPNASAERLAADTAYTDKILGQGQLSAPAHPSAIPQLSQGVSTAYDEAIAKNPIITAEQARKEREDYLGPNIGIAALQEDISKIKDEATADKEQAGYMALLKAGLATMAGTSPFAAVNIGAGAQTGVADFMDAQKEYRKMLEKQRDLTYKLNAAERQEKMDVFKYGEESEKSSRSAYTALKIAQVKEKTENELKKIELELRAKYYNYLQNVPTEAKMQQDIANAVTALQTETDPGKRKQLEDFIKGRQTALSAGRSSRGYGMTENQLAVAKQKVIANVDQALKTDFRYKGLKPEEQAQYRQRLIDTQLEFVLGVNNAMYGGDASSAPSATGIQETPNDILKQYGIQ